ncbi:hypothetical protein C0993_007776, partial [Termitomyces sp. T159_Od127]
RKPRRTSTISRCVMTNGSPPSSYDSRRRPTKPAGTTMLSSSPFAVPCLNTSRMSSASPPSSPVTMVTRPSSPRLTSGIGRIAVSTRHPMRLGTPPGTPTGKVGLPQATRPPALHHLPTPLLGHSWDKDQPTPVDPRDPAHKRNSMLPIRRKPRTPTRPTLTCLRTLPTPRTTPMMRRPCARIGSGTGRGLMYRRRRRRSNGVRGHASCAVSKVTSSMSVLNTRLWDEPCGPLTAKTATSSLWKMTQRF